MANLADVHAVAVSLLHAQGLAQQGWSFGWDRARTRWGCCHHETRRITLSRPLTEARSLEGALQTLLHEVAHALTPGHGHDGVWLRKARELGYTGGARSEEPAAQQTMAKSSRYVAVCDRCRAEFPRYRRPEPGARYTHSGCSGTVTIREREN